MKNTKFAKIITLILAAILLIGAAVGITAAAEDAAPASLSVNIKYRNLAYDSAPRLVYYVESSGVAEGQSVNVLLYNAAPESVTLEGATKVSSIGTLKVSGVEYQAFLSDEIYPKNLRLSVWAAPVILNADGTIATAGSIVEYSVYDYALDRFDMAPTPDQMALYTSLLDFGASVQEVLYEEGKYTDAELEKSGWIDAYYKVTINNVVNGIVLESGGAEYRAAEAENITIVADKFYGGKIFNGFTDEDGNAITAYGEDKTASSWNRVPYALEIGNNVVNAHYLKANSTLSTYEVADFSANNILVSSKHPDKAATATYTDSTTGATVTFTTSGSSNFDTLDGENVLHIQKVLKVLESNHSSWPVGKILTGSNITALGSSSHNLGGGTTYFKSSTGHTTKVADTKYGVTTYVVDFDLYLDMRCDSAGQLRILGSNGSTQKQLWGVNITRAGSNNFYFGINGNSYTDCYDNMSPCTNLYSQRKWHNVRIEYTADPDSNNMSARIFIDGELQEVALVENPSSTGTKYRRPTDSDAAEKIITKSEWTCPYSSASFAGFDDYLYGFDLFTHSSVYDSDLYFDNVYIASESRDYYGKGQYVNNENTETYDNGVGSVIATIKNNLTAITDSDGLTVLNYVSTMGKSNTVTFPIEVEGAEKYIFETDIKWGGASEQDPTASDKSWFGRMGFVSMASDPKGDNYNYINGNANATSSSCSGYRFDLNGPLKIQDNKNATKASLAIGVWYNLRYEYTPLGQDATSGEYKYKLEIFVNNESVWTFEGTTPSDNTDCIGFRIWNRGGTKDNRTYQFDNLYIGAVGGGAITYETVAIDFEGANVGDTPTKNNTGLNSLDTSNNVAAYSIVADPADADNTVIKLDVTGNANSYRDESTFLPSGDITQTKGVWKLTYDFYYSGLTDATVAANTTIHDFILQVGGAWIAQYQFQLEPDGQFTVKANQGDGTGKGITFVQNLELAEDEWHTFTFYVYKGTYNETATPKSDSLVTLLIDGETVAENISTWNSSGGLNEASGISNVGWYVRSLWTKNADTALYEETIANSAYTVYFDNMSCYYLCETMDGIAAAEAAATN